MNNKEIGINLWYVIDADNFIFLLKAKMYLVEGSEEEKLNFLQGRSLLDFEVAKDYLIQPHFNNVVDRVMYLAIPKDIQINMGDDIELFIEIMEEMNKEISALSQFEIPKQPLVCITPLRLNSDNLVVPYDSMERMDLL